MIKTLVIEHCGILISGASVKEWMKIQTLEMNCWYSRSAILLWKGRMIMTHGIYCFQDRNLGQFCLNRGNIFTLFIHSHEKHISLTNRGFTRLDLLLSASFTGALWLNLWSTNIIYYQSLYAFILMNSVIVEMVMSLLVKLSCKLLGFMYNTQG